MGLEIEVIVARRCLRSRREGRQAEQRKQPGRSDVQDVGCVGASQSTLVVRFFSKNSGRRREKPNGSRDEPARRIAENERL